MLFPREKMEEFFQVLDQLKESKNLKRVMGRYKEWLKRLAPQMIGGFASVLPQVRCAFWCRISAFDLDVMCVRWSDAVWVRFAAECAAH